MELTNKVAITIFLTEENVKKFIHFVFDNHIMQNVKNRYVLSRVLHYWSYSIEPNNTYYAHVLYNLRHYVRDMTLSEILYLFPDFLDFYTELTDATKADLKTMYEIAEEHLNTYRRGEAKKSKKVEQIMQWIHETATAENVPPLIIADRIIPVLKAELEKKGEKYYISYDELAHIAFLTEDNVKQLTINDIFETLEHTGLQKIFWQFLQNKYMYLKRYECTMYWYFCEYLKENDIAKSSVTLSYSPTYSTFVANHVLERKTLFMGFCDEVFAKYDFTSKADNVFANDYLARLICSYV